MTELQPAPSKENGDPLVWDGQKLSILDQRLLPQQIEYIEASNYTTVIQAIKDLSVRGAPAIGIAAAFGVVLAAREQLADGRAINNDHFVAALKAINESRPTAINLAWAVKHMENLVTAGAGADELEQAAAAIHREERENNQTMAKLGAELMTSGSRVLTVCNTGGLATGGSGTALAVIVEAWRQQRLQEAFAAETRPWFQGARLTTWELQRAGVRHRLVVDSAVPWTIKQQQVDWVIVGADRVVANGDTANKIGTYAAALAAKEHGAKTMVVIPTTTFDLATASGCQIPIEERDAKEITHPGGRAMAPTDTAVWNPVFDVTPAELVDALVTERGVIVNPNREKIARLMESS